MKIQNRKWLIWVIPCVIFMFGILMKKAAGPYWLAPNLDPSYVYLFDSFRILDGKVPMIVEHPGTTVQLLGAVIIKLLNLSLTNEEILLEIAKSPEFYLSAFNLFLLLLNVLTLGLLGIYAYRKTSQIFFVFMIQSSSLQYLALRSYMQSREILPVIANFSPETFLIIVNNLYLLCVLKLFFGSSEKKDSWLPILFGVTCALGMITKITFLPLVLFPLILIPGVKNKIKFLFSLIVSMFLLVLPILSRFSKIIEWMSSLTTHTGIYGTGSRGFIDGRLVVKNLAILFGWNFLLFLVMLIAGFAVLYFFFFQKQVLAKDEKKRRIIKFLMVSLLTVSAQIFLVVKHLGPHYILPALCFTGMMLGFVYLLQESRKATKLFYIFLIVMVFIQVGVSFDYYQRLDKSNKSLYVFSQEILSQYKDCLILPYYRASSKAYALFFGFRQYAPYGEVLKSEYPYSFFHHRGSNKFYDFAEEVSIDALKQKNDCLLLQGTPNDFGRFISVEEVSVNSSGLEKVYQLISAASDQSIAFFFISQKLAAEGQIKEAILFALKAKSLGYPVDDEYFMKLKYWLDNY